MNPVQIVKLIILETVAKTIRNKYKNIKCPDYFFGVLSSGRSPIPCSAEILRQLLSIKGNKTVEWMFHPGYIDKACSDEIENEFGKMFLTAARQKEADFLLSEETAKMAYEHKHDLISYREL